MHTTLSRRLAAKPLVTLKIICNILQIQSAGPASRGRGPPSEAGRRPHTLCSHRKPGRTMDDGTGARVEEAHGCGHVSEQAQHQLALQH
jgi:hypothetical protein